MATTPWNDESVKIVRCEAIAGLAVGGRATAFDFSGSGGRKTWIGLVRLAAGGNTGPHHHGRHEVAVWVVKGRSQIRWGDRLEFAAEIGPGDFAYFTPYVPHQELNLDADQPVEFIVVRSDNDGIRVDLTIVPAERPRLCA
ncbi:MAG: cupin domain-containing protein [Reyranella sp.]|nr:cupin domain-containing protein [Reyranella sp.]